jgi:tetratricopeptide (TPR) repeat protein
MDSVRWLQLDRWLENLDRLMADPYDRATLIPGHGGALDPGDIRRARDFALAKKAELKGKRSAFLAFRGVYEEQGLEAGLAELDRLWARRDEFFFIHDEFDAYVYRRMTDGDLDAAIGLFKKLSSLFPDAPNAFDSLGEAYLRKGVREMALRAFERCVALDPEHENALARLEELKRGRGSPGGSRLARLERNDND